MEFRRLSVAIAYVFSGYQAAAIAAPAPLSVPADSAPPDSSSGNGDGIQRSTDRPVTRSATAMRPLTVKEIELVMGTNYTTTPLTGTTVTATTGPGTGPISGTGGGSDPGGGTPPGGTGGGGSTGGGGGTPPPAPPHCFAPQPAADRVDSSHIYTNEDGVHTTGYLVPGASNAGVTIGAGVDLGSQSASGLASMGVAQNIITTVTPYLGLKGAAASTAVTKNGYPTLSQADATSLSQALLDSTRATVASRFDATSAVAKFDELPAEAQTVIIDVAYPNGPYLSTSAPSFWADVTSGNWSSAVDELNNWYGTNSSNPRYQGDAALLQSAITAASLPTDTSGGQCP